MTITTLQKLTSLHSQINGLTAEIDRIKGIMAQLANEACTVTVTLTVGKETRKEESKNLKVSADGGYRPYKIELQLALEKYFYAQGIQDYIGEPVINKPRYEEEVKHSFDEANGMRLLNHMLQLKKAEREALMNEAQSIIQSETI